MILSRTILSTQTAARTLIAAAVALSGCSIGLGMPALAADFESVPQANPKVDGNAAPNILAPGLAEVVRAQGSMPLENGTADIPYYGYDGDGPMLPDPVDVQAPGHNVEATKTEPDKNTYLVLRHQHGADPDYDYGTHFLYQGHESGMVDPVSGNEMGYITRVNLDADGDHRVTLLATHDTSGNPLPDFDGSSWDPFAKRLLFTAELGSGGGVWQATVDYPSVAEDISGALGRAGYEGIQTDNDGNLWIIADAGGSNGTMNNRAKQPNSFVYRFVPKNKTDLTHGGKLQALQVISLDNPGQPIIFHPGQADADILSQDMKDLHTYGMVFKTHWVTIHDTDTDGFTPYSANALAKEKFATPFKRPENGQFRPGSRFREFYFDETGDTDNRTRAADYGGFGAVMKLRQSDPSANGGWLTMFYKGDENHSGFDNVAFWTDHEIVFVEDAGDTLHRQRNAFDSGYLFDLNVDYSVPGTEPIRILAQGRDPSATIDSALGSISGNGFQNDGDNEITGFHVSNGDPTAHGLIGTEKPTPFKNGWRVFYTQQHGDNTTFEVIADETGKKSGNGPHYGYRY
jgi:hypothetical protein